MNPEIYKAFIEWKAKPIPEGDPNYPQSLPDFQKKYKVSKADIVAFLDHPTYAEDLVNETLLWAKTKTPELVHSVYNQVKLSKSVSDLAKYLEVVHQIDKKNKEPQNTYNTINILNTIPDERYREILSREVKYLKKSGN